ncbi:MAG: hypothetical protein U9Q82_05520 [Chloroflexota bacterium]|nr:hypothetical protein [Chloroflexota bacterium]
MKGIVSFFLVLLIMPLGHAVMIIIERFYESYMILAAVGITLAGIAMVIATRWVENDGAQSFWGALGGVFIWTGAVEYSFVFAMQRFDIPDSSFTGGEYMLLEYSLGLLIPLLFYILFQESIRCNPILWLRKKLNLMRGPTATGNVNNYGPRTAFEMSAVLWFCYVVMMLAYDVGVKSWATYLEFAVSLGAGIYTLYQLYQKKTWGTAIRYAIPTVMIVWTGVELVSKWGFFEEPWIALNIPFMISVVVAFAITVYLVVDSLQEKRKLTKDIQS